MRFREQIRAVKELPVQIAETTTAIVLLSIIALLAFVMASVALMSGGKRYAN